MNRKQNNNNQKANVNQPKPMVPEVDAFEALVKFALAVITGNIECNKLLGPYRMTLSNHDDQLFMNVLAGCVIEYDHMVEACRNEAYMELPLYFAVRIREILGITIWKGMVA